MSEGILTNAGRDLFAYKQGASEVLIIDRFLLANIPGLDPNDPADPDEPLPDVGDRVAELPVTQSGYVSADQVVYSLYLGTGEGDYTFNWIGLLADDDTLMAVRYIEPIDKYATAGGELGNAITRNFLIAYTDAQAITNITVEASTWQVNFDTATETQKGMIEIADTPEAQAGEDDTRALTPKKLQDVTATETRKGVINVATQIDTNEGEDDQSAVTPAKLAALLTIILSNYSIKGSSDNFEPGVTMTFISAAAPTFWTKSTTHHNKALRIVNTAGGGTGGNVNFTTAFKNQSVSGTIGNTTADGTIANTTAGGTITINNHTLSISRIPSHNHYTETITRSIYDTSGGGSGYGQDTPSGTGPDVDTSFTGGGDAHNHTGSFSGTAHNHNFTGTAHSHNFTGTAINMAVEYVDTIICVRDAL